MRIVDSALQNFAKPQPHLFDIQFHHSGTIPRTSAVNLSSVLSNMAEEPQPPNVQEGADPPDALPASAEDRKAAKAMSSLETNKVEDDTAAVPKKEVDVKALNDAIKFMELGGEQKKPEKVKKEEAPKPLVKVDQADVSLLVR